MTRCSLHSVELTEYRSTIAKMSETMAGVSFTIRRMSYGRRAELLRHLREAGKKVEYLEAGDTLADKVEANLAGAAIDSIYLRWGLESVSGLTIDGEDATAETLLDRGPEAFSREVIAAIKAECGLSKEERKN